MNRPQPEDRRGAITPQLALRVALLGGFALVLFGVLFFRLWFLQVLSGEEYISEARGNRIRKVPIEAPRGRMVDREGKVLVDTKQSRLVELDPSKLPEGAEERARYFKKLARVIDEPWTDIRATVKREVGEQPYANVRVATDVEADQYGYLVEHREDFPGVEPSFGYIRDFPHDRIGAHLFGTTREISESELKEDRYRDLVQGQRIGDGGIEESFDPYLRGQDGFARINTDSLGQRDDALESARKDPVEGDQVQLTLDYEFMKAADRAMEKARGRAQVGEDSVAKAAYVAMNPRTGEVYGMGSYPDYDANLFTKPLREQTYKNLVSKAKGEPLVNRAVQGEFSTGSTFKIVTGAAMLEEGLRTRTQTFEDTGVFKYGTGRFQNAGGTANGTVDFPTAMEVSSDTYFYTLGAKFFERDREELQKWAKRMGFGRTTGLDIPGEAKGVVPGREFLKRKHGQYLKCIKKKKLEAGTTDALNGCGGYEAYWRGGDSVQTAIGQSYQLATPLQVAVSYSSVFTNQLVRPHLGKEIQDADSRTLQEIEVSKRDTDVGLSASTRDAIKDGLALAARGPRGTSTCVWTGWPMKDLPVYGKTGTVERKGAPDTSWYAAVIPTRADPIAIVAMVEGGGFGAEAAAPAVRSMAAQWYDQRNKPGNCGAPTGDDGGGSPEQQGGGGTGAAPVQGATVANPGG